ncbi:hypothetical protein LJ737_20725 [Hymenobacter sp. 15J16-1T3B]|uniref:hypothetical protein n=1 Tax=Hymenobacter sp. 15J16-1T3B TaxID=2886941 RepID=UPI001D10A87D|nr:hypothetical protein [Hymenobacter sp. 15J16-1T3B]MCC3159678.1 hypothetical protein [Hymenobacter sp. 15J16-1T3B]
MAEQLAPDAREFTANGNTYRLNELLTLRRHQEFQKLQVYLMAGTDYRLWHAQIGKAYMCLNQRESKIVDAGIILDNLLTAIPQQLDGAGRNLHAELCALFFNRDGEDASQYNEELMHAKVADWEAAGIPAPFFARRAYDLVLSYLAACTPGTPATNTAAG